MLNKKLDQYQPATVLFYGEDQPTLEFQTKIKARGKFRRLKCDLPPLKINFSKSELSKLGFHKKFDKFKLVSHCLTNGTADNALLKEHCTYKMYNHISDFSFKVKSFTVVYQHDKDPRRVIRGDCFLIEPNKEMAFRNGGTLVDTIGINSTDVTPESYHHVILFNYMIGNTDWSILTQKNVKFLLKKGSDKLIIVPYDFDNCKLVNPPYLVLYPEAKRKKRDNRHVKEKFHNKESLYNELIYFQALEKYHLASCNECEKLQIKEKKKMKIYLKPFFKSIIKIGKMEAIFLKEGS